MAKNYITHQYNNYNQEVQQNRPIVLRMENTKMCTTEMTWQPEKGEIKPTKDNMNKKHITGVITAGID